MVSGTFSDEHQDYFVSNARFRVLLNWVVVAAEDVENESKSVYISKLKENTENRYDPTTNINFHEEFSADERMFWAMAFFRVGERLFSSEFEDLGAIITRPSQIGDAMYLGRMLNGSTGIKVNGHQKP